MTEPILVTMDKAAELLSLSRRMLDKMRLAGAIATIKIGNKRLVPMREVLRVASEPDSTERNPAARSVPGSVAGAIGDDDKINQIIQMVR